MKSQVMKQAWAIAKEAAAKHGGSSKQYINEAMKQAWAAVKNEEVATVEVVEAAPVVEEVKAAPKAPKKNETKGFDFTKFMHGRTKGAAVVRRTETAAEKKARRAANADMYTSKPKRTTKGKAGAEFAAKYMDGIATNVHMGR